MRDHTLRDLHDRLVADPWRIRNKFSEDMETAQDDLLRAGSSSEAAERLCRWLHAHQPCIFARYAVKDRDRRVSICVLRESDLIEGDEHVRRLVQKARTKWRVDALEGRVHSFVLLLVTENLIWAQPGEALLDVARHLLSMWMEGDGVDKIVMDRLYLKEPEGTALEWANGINMFAAQGDKRWWHDHRIPGGIAFAMNSVGHMARYYVGRRPPGVTIPSDSDQDRLCNWALPVAMQTIASASKKPLNKGSWLVPQPDAAARPPFCPKTFSKLLPFDWRNYAAAFHTDHTIQSSFFVDSVERPAQFSDFPGMDFSYLHDPSESDHGLIGRGCHADPAVVAALDEFLPESSGSEEDP